MGCSAIGSRVLWASGFASVSSLASGCDAIHGQILCLGVKISQSRCGTEAGDAGSPLINRQSPLGDFPVHLELAGVLRMVALNSPPALLPTGKAVAPALSPDSGSSSSVVVV